MEAAGELTACCIALLPINLTGGLRWGSCHLLSMEASVGFMGACLALKVGFIHLASLAPRIFWVFSHGGFFGLELTNISWESRHLNPLKRLKESLLITVQAILRCQ